MSNTNFEFEVLIDDLFDNFKSDDFTLSPTDNKKVLSLVNDFESGMWRLEKFSDFVVNHLSEATLSKQEREALIDKPRELLRKSAHKIHLPKNNNKDDKGKASELAEILLYGIMKRYYGALSLVPKIFYKQNRYANALGADSVHIVIDENNGDFSLWLGEVKFYTDINGAMKAAISSIKNLLTDEQLGDENSIIITKLKDLDDDLQHNENILKNIKETLNSRTSLDNIKDKLHIPILLLCECNITKNTKEMSEKYREDIIEYHKKQAEKYFDMQIKELGNIYKYGCIQFHLILFPIHDKQIVVDKFIDEIIFFRK